MSPSPAHSGITRLQRIVSAPAEFLRSQKDILGVLAVTNAIRLMLSLYLKLKIDRCLAQDLSNSLTLAVLSTHVIHIVNMIPSALYLIEDRQYNMGYVVVVETLLLLGQALERQTKATSLVNLLLLELVTFAVIALIQLDFFKFLVETVSTATDKRLSFYEYFMKFLFEAPPADYFMIVNTESDTNMEFASFSQPMADIFTSKLPLE
jgi:hypothetical protein